MIPTLVTDVNFLVFKRGALGWFFGPSIEVEIFGQPFSVFECLVKNFIHKINLL
jgi:hypothetical protein